MCLNLNLFLSGFISSLPQLAWEKGYVVVVANISINDLMMLVAKYEAMSQDFLLTDSTYIEQEDLHAMMTKY